MNSSEKAIVPQKRTMQSMVQSYVVIIGLQSFRAERGLVDAYTLLGVIKLEKLDISQNN